MTRSTALAAVITSGLTIGSCTTRTHAQPMLSISDGFGSSSFNTWSIIVTPQSQSGTFLATGGNPGTYASLVVTSSVNNRLGTGFQYRGVGSNIVLGSLATQITLGADLRRTSVISPGTPEPEFVPIIVQGTRLYQPASFIPAPTSNQWVTIAPVTFNISEFTNSSGIPLNPAASVTVGFWWRFNPTPSLPAPAAYGVGVDNLTITVIPAPGALATLLLGLPMLTRRRRA
jgi:hypothetical protein